MLDANEYAMQPPNSALFTLLLRRSSVTFFRVHFLLVSFSVGYLTLSQSALVTFTAHFTQGRNVEIFRRRAKADDATLYHVFKSKWE